MYQCLRSTLYELCSQLLDRGDGLSGDLGQRLEKGKAAKMDAEGHRESDSSELEDIEPDYRDRESKQVSWRAKDELQVNNDQPRFGKGTRKKHK